jgi:hypothetical protein
MSAKEKDESTAPLMFFPSRNLYNIFVREWASSLLLQILFFSVILYFFSNYVSPLKASLFTLVIPAFRLGIDSMHKRVRKVVIDEQNKIMQVDLKAFVFSIETFTIPFDDLAIQVENSYPLFNRNKKSTVVTILKNKMEICMINSTTAYFTEENIQLIIRTLNHSKIKINYK